jgi:competence protein ComEC
VPSPALIPAFALAAGAACGIHLHAPEPFWIAGLVSALILASVALARHSTPLLIAGVVVGALSAGWVLGDRAREAALHTSLRAVLDREYGGFAIDRVAVGGPHDPVATRIVLIEDAAWSEQFTSLRGRVRGIRINGEWERVEGGVILSIGGSITPKQAEQWLAGRELELPVTYRRPARYLDEGVPDFERDLALGGTTLFGSVKSGLLVSIRARGGPLKERAARVRLRVRAATAAWVGRYSGLSAAIVNAILIGDRSGLPADVRVRLQAAGTYHVIAISGGNIAILAMLAGGLLMLCGLSGRGAALGTLIVLLLYASIVTAGASVWRATLMAALYLAARILDHRSSPWHAMAIAAMAVVVVQPLDVRDAGFLLTFGATAGLLEVARRLTRFEQLRSWVRWLIGAIAASLAAEIALLPIAASTFSRVTGAGIVLNLIAVPVMTMTQVAGMVVAVTAALPVIAAPAGWVAHAGAALLVGSARLVDVAPWLTTRVPPPQASLVGVYYVALGIALWRRGRTRVAATVTWAIAGMAIALGVDAAAFRQPPEPTLQLTVFDVGQGDSLLLELPDRSTLMVDTGGAPFGSGTFDIGGRVLAPALWARGMRRLDRLLITHPDPDHVGGAAAVVQDFSPAGLWHGIPVPSNPPLSALAALAARERIPMGELRAGKEWTAGEARVRVLHPPPPDWERRRVRNDDSVVLEVVYHDVAMLLTGDIGADIERAILPQLTHAPIRILKVAHHGSRTSSSAALLNGWQPQIALISSGRGNTFGHPAPDVVARLNSAGARIYRTDRDGQIALSTDGRSVKVRTFTGEER